MPPSNIFYDEIEWGAANGIINGYTNGKFGPNDNVNRGQAAAFLSHYNDAIHVISENVTPTGTSQLVEAECPVGERAIGGAANTVQTNVFIADTFLDGRTFQARLEAEDGGPLIYDIEVQAICAPDSVAHPGTGIGEGLPLEEIE